MKDRPRRLVVLWLGAIGFLIAIAGGCWVLVAPVLEVRRVLQQTLNEDRSLLARQSLAALDRMMTHPTWDMSMDTVRQFLVKMIS